MITAVLFDLDGTIADTAPDLGGALNAMLAEDGRAAIPLPALRHLVSAGARGLIRLGYGVKPEDASFAELRQRFLDHYERALCVETRLFAGIAELLNGLDSQGMPWGVVTNKPERYTLPLMAALGLATRSACTVSGDTVPQPKPAPDALHHAATLLGARPESLIYVGDDLRDIVAGRAAGMATVAAAYGYLGDGPPVQQWQADHIIHAPAQMSEVLACYTDSALERAGNHPI